MNRDQLRDPTFQTNQRNLTRRIRDDLDLPSRHEYRHFRMIYRSDLSRNNEGELANKISYSQIQGS